MRQLGPDEEEQFGLVWKKTSHPLNRHIVCIQHGGKWKLNDGSTAGMGSFYHYKEAIKVLWPEFAWHFWNDLLLEKWLGYRTIGVMGPASSGKTCTFAVIHLMDYYCFPGQTTTLVCSTTKERLEDRIWGEIKKWHKLAKQRFSWIPGNMIENRQRIVTDHKDQSSEGRDFRNGLLGVPCKKGNSITGMQDFIGIKAKRLRLCGDELQALPRGFIDSTANLFKNPDCKITGLGNPSDTMDSLGLLCEPSAAIGGWESGIDQTPKTKSWETRWPQGVCVQLCGSDSPNLRVAKDELIPYPFLITRQNMEDDAAIWGSDDWHYTMFNEGRMPRGQGSRRIITRRLCEKGGAFDEPRWNDSNITHVGFLDAAYRGIGGDRCVYGHLKFGYETPADISTAVAQALIDQEWKRKTLKQILALVELKIIPVNQSIGLPSDEPEDQIVAFVRKENEERGIPPQNFFFDSGMRTSLVTCFARKYSNKVNSIDCGGQPSPNPVSEMIDIPCNEYYSKLITELWYSVRLIIECGQFRGMSNEVMTEGCQREFKKDVGRNKIEIESKDEMKKKTGRSPDLFDALAIGCEGAKRLGFRIGALRETEEMIEDERWKSKLRERSRQFHKARSLNYSA